MKNEDIYRQRERDLKAAYNRLASVHGINFNYLSATSIAQMLLEQEAPRFYVEPKWAYEIIRRYRKTGVMKGNVAMQKDLIAQYQKLKKAYPKLHVWQLCELLVTCPAKSFYMSSHRIIEIIFGYTGRNGKRK